jgi:hypothetical protein
MIHGRDRDEVLNLVAQLEEQCGLHDVPHEVLFSQRRFKQCGARYVASGQETDHHAQRSAASGG